MIGWLLDWMTRHGRPDGDGDLADRTFYDIDSRHAALAVRLRALQAQANAKRPPPSPAPPDDHSHE